MEALDIVLLAGATAWLSYALVNKDGPYKILQSFRIFVGNHLGSNSPLGCVFCTSFWVGLLLVCMHTYGYSLLTFIIYYFGILGIAAVFYGAFE